MRLRGLKRKSGLGKIALLGLFTLMCGGMVLAAIWISAIRREAQSYDLAQLRNLSELSLILDRHGKIYTWLPGEHRILISLEEVPPHVIQALVAREDHRFYRHRGVDFQGIARACWNNLREGRIVEGGSTLTQQLARNTFDLRSRTFRRKCLEAFLARRIESSFSKRDILELYLNRVYFGSGAYGIESAARTYFGKHASDLALAEGALLVGLLPSPSAYSPFKDREVALKQRQIVLDRMKAGGFISDAVFQSASSSSPKFEDVDHQRMFFVEDYGTDAVLRELQKVLSPEVLARGGLRIRSTLDPSLQGRAQSILNDQLSRVERLKGFSHPSMRTVLKRAEHADSGESEYLQGALVMMENDSGAIRAIVGGRDYLKSRFNRAVQARRQVGSAVKPFVYTAAIQAGLRPGTLVDDSDIRAGEIRGLRKDWFPANYDSKGYGFQRADFGLLYSRNTMSVRVGELVGARAVAQMLEKIGVADHVPPYPSIYLGSFETTLRELTAAYTLFPNGGIKVDSRLIEKIEHRDGRPLYHAKVNRRPILPADSAWVTSQILQDVVKTGTAAMARSYGFRKPGAGKTGTTDEFRDAWFVGYTSSLTCGVWVGFDRPRTIMNKGSGSMLALPVWSLVMQHASGKKEYTAHPFEPPMDLRSVRLCSHSGAFASLMCEYSGAGYTVTLPVTLLPEHRCGLVHDIPEYAYGDSGAEAGIAQAEFSRELTPTGRHREDDSIGLRRRAFQDPSEGNQPIQGSRRVVVCRVSGAYANSGCEWAETVVTMDLPLNRLPIGRCPTHPEIPIAPAMP
jgi:penicillin-binding protein 1A